MTLYGGGPLAAHVCETGQICLGISCAVPPPFLLQTMKPQLLDQADVLDRIESLTAIAKQRGIELPKPTGDLLSDLERMEAAVPQSLMPTQMTRQTSTPNPKVGTPEFLATFGQAYDQLTPSQRAEVMMENGPALRDLILKQERESRTSPKAN